jgi:hypothetical protein
MLGRLGIVRVGRAVRIGKVGRTVKIGRVGWAVRIGRVGRAVGREGIHSQLGKLNTFHKIRFL